MSTPIPILSGAEFFRQQIPSGMIEPGTIAGNILGFTPDRFEADGGSYLWRTDNEIMISSIFCVAPGNGHFKALVDRIESLGFTVAVPTPLGHMQAILEHWGWTPIVEETEDLGGVEVWRRPIPSQKPAPKDYEPARLILNENVNALAEEKVEVTTNLDNLDICFVCTTHDGIKHMTPSRPVWELSPDFLRLDAGLVVVSILKERRRRQEKTNDKQKTNQETS